MRALALYWSRIYYLNFLLLALRDYCHDPDFRQTCCHCEYTAARGMIFSVLEQVVKVKEQILAMIIMKCAIPVYPRPSLSLTVQPNGVGPIRLPFFLACRLIAALFYNSRWPYTFLNSSILPSILFADTHQHQRLKQQAAH